MSEVVVLDTGPLVALLDESEAKHAAVAHVLQGLRPPFFTVEPVLGEACFLLRNIPGSAETVMRLLRSRAVRIGLSLSDEAGPVEALLAKYADVPMSLADAALVRLSELQPRSAVLTFDSDFRVYRRNRRERIPLIEC